MENSISTFDVIIVNYYSIIYFLSIYEIMYRKLNEIINISFESMASACSFSGGGGESSSDSCTCDCSQAEAILQCTIGCYGQSPDDCDGTAATATSILKCCESKGTPCETISGTCN